MRTPIVHGTTFLTLLGGGSVTSEALATALEIAPILVALDGGADIALAHGITPQAVIGDFDSVSDAVRAELGPDRMHLNGDQETTDFEKGLLSTDAPLILGVGLTGLRRDHELAAYHALMRFAHKRCIIVAQSDVIALCPPEMTLDVPDGTRVSLFPLAPVIAHGTNLRWPVDALALAPGGRIGTSNTATGGPVRLRVDAPGLLVILPVDKVEALVQAMTTAPRTWPLPIGAA